MSSRRLIAWGKHSLDRRGSQLTPALPAPCPNTACKPAGRFCGPPSPAAPPRESRCRHRPGILSRSKRPSVSSFSCHSFPGNQPDGIHVVVENRLLAATVPFEGDAGPVGVGNGPLVILVIPPANPGAGFQQSGLGACHSFCRFSAVLLRWPKRRHRLLCRI